MLIDVRVSPKASRNALTGWHAGALKVSVTAAPERGKANEAVEALLAGLLELPRGAVRVVAGETARNKRVEIAGLEAAELQARLRTVMEHTPARHL